MSELTLRPLGIKMNPREGMAFRSAHLVGLLSFLLAIIAGISLAYRKYGPFDFLFKLSISLLGMLLISLFVLGAFQGRRLRLRQRELDQNAKRIGIGMSEKELTEILGEPDFKDLNSTLIVKRRDQANRGKLWRYDYWPKARFYRSWVWSFYLDEPTKRIVQIHRGEIIVDFLRAVV